MPRTHEMSTSLQIGNLSTVEQDLGRMCRYATRADGLGIRRLALCVNRGKVGKTAR